MSENYRKGIRNWNITSAILQGCLCIAAIIFLGVTIKNAENFPLFIGEYNGPNDCNTILTTNGTLLIALLIGFTLITCIIHSLYASNKRNYYKKVERGNNSIRWFEYAVTATIMLLVIALSSRVFGVESLIFIAASSVGLMLLGDVVEKSLRRSVKGDGLGRRNAITCTFIGWFLMLTIFGVIFKNFGQAVSTENSKVPGFVYAVVIVMFLLFATFGFIQIYDVVIRSKPKENFDSVTHGYKLEKIYTTNSMIAKTLLVLLLLGGLAGRSSDPVMMENPKKKSRAVILTTLKSTH